MSARIMPALACLKVNAPVSAASAQPRTGSGILALMKAINRRLHTTFIFSSHDQKVIDFADHYIGIEAGELRFLGIRKDDKWLGRDEQAGRPSVGPLGAPPQAAHG